MSPLDIIERPRITVVEEAKAIYAKALDVAGAGKAVRATITEFQRSTSIVSVISRLARANGHRAHTLRVTGALIVWVDAKECPLRPVTVDVVARPEGRKG